MALEHESVWLLYIWGNCRYDYISCLATMGAGGILARTWGKSEKLGFERNQETFLVQNWYFKRGLALIIVVLALIIIPSYINSSTNHSNARSTFLQWTFFWIANILQSFFVAKEL